MNIFKNNNLLLVGSTILIVLAIALVAILNRANAPTATTGDVRARAATAKTLQVNATVASLEETRGIVIVTNLYFADVSRSGDAKDLGSWIVTPPATFSWGSVVPGDPVVIGVDAASFLVAKHTLTAVSVVPGTK